MEIRVSPLRILAAAVLLTICSAGIWLWWWNTPVAVTATQIVKVIDADIHPDRVRFCESFTMTPDAFRAYWKEARPIFEFELHDYSIGSCEFQSKEGDTEYAVGIGGVGMVTKGDATRYYVKKGAKSELGP